MEIIESRSIEYEAMFLRTVRDCSEECISFVCEYHNHAGYETTVHLAKICAFKCLRFANELEYNTVFKEHRLMAMISACQTVYLDFIKKNNVSLNRYIAALKECVTEGTHLLDNRSSVMNNY